MSFIGRSLLASAIIIPTLAVGAVSDRIRDWTKPPPPQMHLAPPKEAPRPPEVLASVVEVVAKRHKLSPLLLTAIAEVESGQDATNSAYRFEEHVFSRVKRRDHATSWGVMQVMGHNIPKFCSDLAQGYADIVGSKNLEANIECGTRILVSCMRYAQKNGASTRSNIIQKAISCYNGDDTGKYASKVMYAIGELALERL